MGFTPIEEKALREDVYACTSIIKRLSMRKRELLLQVDAIDAELMITMKDKQKLQTKLHGIRVIPMGKSGIILPGEKSSSIDIKGMSDEDAEALLLALLQKTSQ